MLLSDALLNWLQLHLVSERRPQDVAASESVEHVEEILSQQFNVHTLTVTKNEQSQYTVRYRTDREEQSQSFSSGAAEVLLEFILQNPERYDFG